MGYYINIFILVWLILILHYSSHYHVFIFPGKVGIYNTIKMSDDIYLYITIVMYVIIYIVLHLLYIYIYIYHANANTNIGTLYIYIYIYI